MTNEEDDISLVASGVSFGEEFTRSANQTEDLESLYEAACNLFLGRNGLPSRRMENREASPSEIIEKIALIISKTYVACNDSYQLSDDEALMLIQDHLIQYNPTIIARNKNKRLPKRLSL